VQLIATAHGQTLENLLINPTLNDLLGGIQSVTLSDEEARRRGTQKSVQERKAPPTFDVLIEMQDRDRVSIHQPLADIVDAALRGASLRPKIRVRTREGRIISNVELEASTTQNAPQTGALPPPRRGPRAIFPYGVSRGYLEQSVRELELPVKVLGNPEGADLVLTLKNYYRRRPESLRQAEANGIPIHILRSNSVAHVRDALTRIYSTDRQDGLVQRALDETRDAITRVKETLEPLEMAPQNAYVRRLQHQLVSEQELVARSTGKEPRRRLRILPSNDFE
jgi:hypothetical protein